MPNYDCNFRNVLMFIPPYFWTAFGRVGFPAQITPISNSFLFESGTFITGVPSPHGSFRSFSPL